MADATLQQNHKPHKITIKCVGCEKTQTLRALKVAPAEFYACSWACADTVPHPSGLACRIMFNAAGGFYGFTHAEPTEEAAAAINRARDILHQGLK